MKGYIVYILFLIPSLIVLLGAFILLFKAKCSKDVRLCFLVLLVLLSICMALYAHYYHPVVQERNIWIFDMLYVFLVPFCPPLYLLFLNKLTDKEKTPSLNLLAFLPAILFGTMLVSAEILMTETERQAFMANEIFGYSIQIESSLAYNWMTLLGKRIFGILIAVEGMFVMIYGEFRLTAYSRLLEKYYSEKRSNNMKKVRGIHTFSVMVAALFVCLAVIPFSAAVDMLWFLAIILVIDMVMVSLIISYVIKVEYSAEDLYAMMDDEGSKTYPSNIVDDTNVGPIWDNKSYINTRKSVEPIPPLISRIDAVMENENLFLRSDLSIVMLAEKVGTNRTYVSKAIKDTKGCNFSDYVNRFRLDYAIELMKKTPKENILIQDIALQCGCGSIQTFYRYFKMFFNETPTQWLEKNK